MMNPVFMSIILIFWAGFIGFFSSFNIFWLDVVEPINDLLFMLLPIEESLCIDFLGVGMMLSA